MPPFSELKKKLLYIHIILLTPLYSQITFIGGKFLSERYWNAGKFTNSLTKPFYKDYENTLSLITKGYIYHIDLINFEYKNYITYYGWNPLSGENVSKKRIMPYNFTVNVLPKNHFPLSATIKNEKLEDITKREKTSFNISQGIRFKNFPFIKFLYGKTYNYEKSENIGMNLNYSMRKHNFFFSYEKKNYQSDLYLNNINSTYHFQIPGKWNIRNLFYYFKTPYSLFYNNNMFLRKWWGINKRYTMLMNYLKNRHSRTLKLNNSYWHKFSNFVSTENSFNISSAKTYGETHELRTFQLGHRMSFSSTMGNYEVEDSPSLSLDFSEKGGKWGWGHFIGNRIVGNYYPSRKTKIKGYFDVSYNSKKDYQTSLKRGHFSYKLGTNLNLLPFLYHSLTISMDYSFLNVKYGYNDYPSTRTNISMFYRIKKPFILELNYYFDRGNSQRMSYTHHKFSMTVLPSRKFFDLILIQEKLIYRKNTQINAFENKIKLSIIPSSKMNLIFDIEHSQTIYPKLESNFIFHFLFKRGFRVL